MNFLKPCPFCGGENIKIKTMKWNNITDWEYVRCSSCTANVRHFDRHKACDAWNKRACEVDES